MRIQKEAENTITLVFSITSSSKTIFKLEMLNAEGLSYYIFTPLYLVSLLKKLSFFVFTLSGL